MPTRAPHTTCSQVNVTKAGKRLFSMITYAGYIGAPTGVRPGVFRYHIHNLDSRHDCTVPAIAQSVAIQIMFPAFHLRFK